MFALNIPSTFGDTLDCRINGKPKRVTWRDEHTLVIAAVSYATAPVETDKFGASWTGLEALASSHPLRWRRIAKRGPRRSAGGEHKYGKSRDTPEDHSPMDIAPQGQAADRRAGSRVCESGSNEFSALPTLIARPP